MHTLKRKTGLGLRTRNREKERVKSLKSNRNCYVRELVLAFEITSKTVDAVGRVIDDESTKARTDQRERERRGVTPPVYVNQAF